MSDRIFKNAKAILLPNIFERIMGLNKIAKQRKGGVSKPSMSKLKKPTIQVPKDFYDKLQNKKGYIPKGKV